jgi:VWFA-related protein
LVLCAAAAVLAQSGSEIRGVTLGIYPYTPWTELTFRAETQLVEVPVVVRDRDGNSVGTLEKDDFEVRDKGEKRDIVAFAVYHHAQESETGSKPAAKPTAPRPAAPPARPRNIGILFDDLNSPLSEFRRSQAAALQFVREKLAPGDRVAVFSTYGEQLVPFTSDVAVLTAGIEKMRARPRVLDKGYCPTMTPMDAYLIEVREDGNALAVKMSEARSCMGQGANARVVQVQAKSVWMQARDASVRTLRSISGIAQGMAELPGDRILLLASGGFPSGTLEFEQDRVVAHALRAKVVINALDAKGLFTDNVQELEWDGNVRSIMFTQSVAVEEKLEANSVLAYLATSTGGRFYQNSNDMAEGFRVLAAVPEYTYLLAFAPDPNPDEKLHKLKVRVTARGRYSVQARRGYFATRQEPRAADGPRRIDRELFTGSRLSEVPVSFIPNGGQTNDGLSELRVVMRLAVGDLPLVEDSGVRTAEFHLIAALLDENQQFVTGVEGVVGLALTEETFAQLSRTGLNGQFRLHAPPGRYLLRTVFENVESGGFTTRTHLVEIP